MRGSHSDNVYKTETGQEQMFIICKADHKLAEMLAYPVMGQNWQIAAERPSILNMESMGVRMPCSIMVKCLAHKCSRLY